MEPVAQSKQGGNGEKAFDPVRSIDRRSQAVAAEVGDKLVKTAAEPDDEKKIEPLDCDSEGLHETTAHDFTRVVFYRIMLKGGAESLLLNCLDFCCYRVRTFAESGCPAPCKLFLTC